MADASRGRGRGRERARGRGVDREGEGEGERHRDQRGLEIAALGRQIRDLERQLAEARVGSTAGEEGEESETRHSSEAGGDEEDSNPWGTPNQRRNQGFRQGDTQAHQNLGIKIDIPDFEGKYHPDEFIDWLHTVERVFDVKNLSEEQKVKLVAIKLRKHASLWWEHLTVRRVRERKPKIKTWGKMKKKLMAKFLPLQYKQEAFIEYHNFRQKTLTVEQYNHEFDLLRMRCDVSEEEEQVVARYLAGLRPEISDVVYLQQYYSYEDVCRLALKIESQQKRRAVGSRWQYRSSGGEADKRAPVTKPKPTSTPSHTQSPKTCPERGQDNRGAMTGRRCFKCQGLGHLMADCPNRQMITFVEEEVAPVYDDYEDGDPICDCIDGFEPKNLDGNWTSGGVKKSQLWCERNSSSLIEKDGFLEVDSAKLPDFANLLNDNGQIGDENPLSEDEEITHADSSGSGQHSTVSDANSAFSSLSSTCETYVPVLVRMLGLDNDHRDREQAVIALWKYSLGGKNYVDNIMKFRGCVNLIVNLVTSESSRSCEAATGLLRMISSVNSYRDVVAESGAMEETTALLRRASLTFEVKEQSLCMLWNLSTDEKLGQKIANPGLLPLVVRCLDDEDMKIVEAAGGVLANLALNPSNHKILVEVDVIPKLAKFLTCETEASKVIKKEARNALLELAKDNYYKILIMEEGLVLVPLLGSAAYASFKPALYSWPSLPDGTELRRNSTVSSRYGAAELLIGLNVEDNTDKIIDKIKMDAIVGRTHQQFLARIGAIENGDDSKSSRELSTSFHHTLLPWRDGIARLVLILELEDEVAIGRAADAIADASINETIRISFREAGAVQRLVYLLSHNSDALQLPVLNALEKLSVSNRLCETMEMEDVTQTLVDILKDSKTSGALMEKTLSILARIWDPNKQMKFTFYERPVNGSRESTGSGNRNAASLSGGKMADVKHMLDSALVARLATMLNTGSSIFQAKIASILEFITMVEPCIDTVVATHLESGLLAVFQQNLPKDMEEDVEKEPDPAFLEEAGLAISSASRLLTKLIDLPQFHNTINSDNFTKLLRQILKSDIPLHHKDWVAGCLVRLSLFSSPIESSITTEITLYETIPRLIEQIKTSSTNRQEDAVVQLNRIISEGVEGASQAIVSHGGVFPLVKVIEEGNDRGVEAGIAILYNLSMDSENHSAILSAGVVPVLTRMVRSETSHYMRALRLLRNLPV